MNNELEAMVNFIERERGVSREIVLTAIEGAIEQTARRNPDVTNDLRVSINRSDLSLRIFDTLVVSDEETGTGFISLARARRLKPTAAEGDEIEVELPAAKLGRIAAQNTRQLIMQKIRDAVSDNTFSEFKGRVDEIVSGTVVGQNHRDLYVKVGNVEMVLPGRERIPGEEFQVGDSIRAAIHSVKKPESNGPSVTLSRTSSGFLRTLFRLEVSEIADGVVEIMDVARDPGYRSKISVRSLDDKVDPVGACVGLKGARVRNIVRELGGEKLDIVRWSEDVKTYVKQALSPAPLESVEVDPLAERPTVNVVVAPEHYSLAIGKRGQNVRLTSKLTGWHVEIAKSMALASFEDQKADAIKTLADTFSIPTAQATKVADAGFLTVEGIVATDEANFINSTGLDEVTAKGLYAAARAVAKLMGALPESDGDLAGDGD